jgi:hypothetical protein
LRQVFEIFGWVAVAVAAAATGCSGSSTQKEETASNDDGGREDEDSVSVPVPMGLLASLALSETAQGVSSASSAGQTAVDAGNAVGDVFGSDSAYWSREVNDFVTALFGVSGYFQARAVDVPKGGAVTFSLPEATQASVRTKPKYVRVEDASEEAAGRFRVRIYCLEAPPSDKVPNTPDRPLNECRVFTVDVDQDDPAVARIVVDGVGPSPLDEKRSTYTTFSYSSREPVVETLARDDPPFETRPAQVRSRLAFDRATGHVRMEAIGVWGDPPVDLVKYKDILPRFQAGAARKGDLYLNWTAAKGGSPDSVQSLAHIPVEDRAELPAGPLAMANFTTYGYSRWIYDALDAQARSPAVNPDCQTLGATLKAASATNGAAVPASVAALPDDVCVETDNGVTAQLLFKAVVDACSVPGAAAAVPLKLKSFFSLAGATAVQDLALCTSAAVSLPFAQTLQYFTVLGSARVSVSPPQKPSTTHRELEKAFLGTTRFLDPAGIDDIVYPPMRSHLSEADFGDAREGLEPAP